MLAYRITFLTARETETHTVVMLAEILPRIAQSVQSEGMKITWKAAEPGDFE